MADRVVRMEEVFAVEHENRGDKVVLKITGRVGGARVRVELAGCAWQVRDMVKHLRAGTAEHLEKWAGTQRAIGVHAP